MKNITITLDADTAHRARVEAAQRNLSLSRFVGEVLRERLRKADDYEKAYRQFLTMKPVPLKGPPERYPTRDELYDRPVLRRR